MRHLATVRTIDRITPIMDADRIVVAHIGGWPVVVSKEEHRVGDKIVYFEPDSMLPLSNPLFRPLESRGRHAENSSGEECVVLKTIRLRKQLSQGLAMTLEELGLPDSIMPGADVSDVLGIEKYDPPEVIMNNMTLRPMPGFVVKTDEERVQNLPELVDWIREDPSRANLYHASEKLDGTSTSFYSVYNEDGREDRHGACSRNNEVSEPEDHSINIYWKNFDKYSILDRLNKIHDRYPDARTIVIQGESTGPGVNGNRLERKTLEFHAFNVLMDHVRMEPCRPLTMTARDDGTVRPGRGLVDILEDISVPRIDVKLSDSDLTMDGIIALSYGMHSALEPSRLAEGIVWRYDGRPVPGMLPEWRHFKVINNSYLLKDKR